MTPSAPRLVGLAGLATFLLACGEPAPVTQIILVRHGEKASPAPNPRDPDLSEAGQARARALASVVAHADVRAVYATQFKRTQATVAPFAQAAKLAIQQRDAGDAAGLARDIREHHLGQTVLVAAHSNTVPEIIKALGGPDVPELDEDDFDNLFVVTLRGADTSLVHLTYGAQ